MTPKEIGKLTLADLEAIAARFESAARTIREAQSLLGGAPAAQAPAPAPVHRLRPSTKGAQLTEEEIAEREALLTNIRGPASDEDFPPSIAAALGGV